MAARPKPKASRATSSSASGRLPGGLHLLQKEAEERWAMSDKVLHRLSKRTPLDPAPKLRSGDGFTPLVFSIVHQQVSMAAAVTIRARLVKLLGGKVTPRR